MSDSNIDARLVAKNLGIKEKNINRIYNLEEYDISLIKNKSIYSNKKTLIKIKNFEIQTYKTKVDILSIKSNPLYREVTYKIYNDTKYFILSKTDGDVLIDIRDKKGKKISFTKIKYIENLKKEWKSNAHWVENIKEDLRKKGISPESIEDIFYKEILPDNSWINILYEIDNTNIEYPITITMKSRPQYSFKLFYFDPFYSGWWNESWEYRSIYYLKNTNNYSLKNNSVLLILNSTNFKWDLANSDLSDIRITQFNETTQTETLLSHWIEYVDSVNKKGYVWVRVQNLSANGNITLFIYHYNPDAADESDGYKTFDFFDDFPGTSLDSSKWVDVDGSYTVSDGMFKGTGGDSIEHVRTAQYFYMPFVVGISMMAQTSEDFDGGVAVGNASGDITIATDDYPGGNVMYIHYPDWWSNTISGGGSGVSTSSWRTYKLIMKNNSLEWYNYEDDTTTSSTNAPPIRDGYVFIVNDADSSSQTAYFDYIYVTKYYHNDTILIYNSTEYVGSFNVTITFPPNNMKLYRYESFYLNSTVKARGFSLYDNGSKILSDYNDFIYYDYMENITIIDASPEDYLKLAPLTTDWYSGYSDWLYRKPINITNPNNEDLKDFQINLTIDTQTLISQGKMNTTCQDIRFTYYNETSKQEKPIPYWIESGCDTSNTIIWIKVPLLKANSNTTVYMYYGNNDTLSDENPDEVFIFFDDFESGSLDTSKWNDDPDTTVETDPVYNTGVMKVNGGNEILGACTIKSMSADIFVDFWMREEETRSDFDSGLKIGNIYFISDDGSGSQCIDTSVCYPSGSQTDTTFHHYRITLRDGYQYIIDLNNGYSTSNTLSYVSGSLCGFNDADSSSNPARYDLIYVRKYAENMTFDSYMGEEEENDLTYHENGTYITTLDFFSISINYTNITYIATIPQNTSLTLYARTSNDKLSWNSWKVITNSTYPDLPSERYLQLMVQMNTTDNKTSPKLYKIQIDYERVYNSPYAWSQYFSLAAPLKFLIDDSSEDFYNASYRENVTVSVKHGELFLMNNSLKSWYDYDWLYRKPINITNPNNEDLKDFQINLTIDTQTLISQGKMNTTCQDIRFTYYNETSKQEKPIPYWIESGCDTSNTIIWIKVPLLKANSNTTVYMYYGNNDTLSDENPDEVFIFFDDFESGSLDTSKWNDDPDTTVETDPVYNTGVMKVNGGNEILGACTIKSMSADIFVDFWMREEETRSDFDSGLKIGNIYFISDDGSGSQCIDTSVCYPSGSQTDTTFHHYRITLRDGYQYIIDLNNGYSTSNTLSYVSGSLCGFNDADSSSNPARYDLIYVRKYAENATFKSYVGSEEKRKIENSGIYISKVFNIGTAEYQFNKFYWYGKDMQYSDTTFYVRTSPDGSAWSEWYLMDNNTVIEAPPDKYVQYKVEFTSTYGNESDIIDKIQLGYRVLIPSFVIMKPSSIFSTTNPHTCSLEEVKKNTSSCKCNISWVITPKQEGNYTIRIKVNSTNQYIEDAYSQEINVTVFIRTYIIDFTIIPSVQGQGRNITLRAKLVNDLNEPLSAHNITFYDATANKYYGTALTDENGYAEITYTIPKDEILGYHTVYAMFNGSWPEFLEKSNASSQYKVSSVPQINKIYALPYWQGNHQIIRLRANITDEVGVDTALIYVYNSTNDVIVDGASMSYIGNDLYEYNFSSWHADKFKFYVWVNNTDGIDNQSDFAYFVVDVKAEFSVKTEKDKYRNFEKVYLSNYDYDWFNTSWKYRLPIELYNPNDESVCFDVINITLNTKQLISQGKMKNSCEDLRITVIKNIYLVELNITNTNSVSFTDRSVKITINNKEIVANMNEDGSDIRIFETRVENPYHNDTFLDYWVESINKEAGTAIIWIKIPYIGAHKTKTLYMYYGNKNALNKQNYSAVFNKVIGEARTFILNSTNTTISFMHAYSQSPIIIASLNSENEADQAFVRILSISTNEFTAKIEESVALDGVHGNENASYIAMLPGQWLVGGKYIEVGTSTVDSSYSTVTFQKVFSSKPVVLTQTLTYNEADPVKTRVDNILTGSFEVKLEETDTSDTSHTYEDIGYIAMQPMSFKIDTFRMQCDIRSHNQPTGDDWTLYTLSFRDAFPAVVAKVLSENGGDNLHERIRNVKLGSFEYQMEEEAGYDGYHTTEDNGYLAISNATLIYGLPYGDYSMSTTVGDPQVIGSTYEEIPYWIESGCNTSNTLIWTQVPIINSHDKTYLYIYYGNPSAEDKQNKSAVFSYLCKKSLYYVLDEDIASANLQISAYYNNTEFEIGGYSSTVDKQQIATISSSYLSLGSALKSNKPLSTTTLSSGNGDALTPKIALGKEFISYAIRGTEYLTVLSFGDDNIIEFYSISGGTYNKVGSLSLNYEQANTFTYDFSDGVAIYVNSTKPILLHRKAESNYDFFTVFPPNKEWYGVPSNNLVITALKANTHITIYRSDQNTPTTITLTNAGDSYTSGSLGQQGNAPAMYIKADKPVYALAYADGDGTEGTTFLPKHELEDEYILPADAEYVAIATQDADATCYAYYANNTLAASQHASASNTSYPNPGFVRFGNLPGGTMINCTSPFFAYFERAGSYETNLYGIKHFRNAFEYSIVQINRTEEDVYNNLKNRGNTTLKGYLYMIVEEETSTGWSLVFPGGVIINDKADGNLRTLLPGEEINLTQLWKSEGGWDTSDHAPGRYRVYAAFVDENMNPIRDSFGNRLEDYYIFEIIESELRMTKLEHENIYKGNVKEYEVGDNIALINITVKAYNNTAIDAKVELDLVKKDKSYAGFGPLNEIYSCGNIPYDSECYAIYDNSSNGYPIPLTAQGNYMFYWNVTMTLENGKTRSNGTEYIIVHDLRNNVSSTLQPTRIYIGGNKLAYYNFTLYNAWSVNISDVNVTINCDPTLNCTCALPGQENQQNICYLGNISGNTYAYANFSINYTQSTQQGDYIINATLQYVNIGDEYKKWEELAPQTLEVRYQGILVITPYTYPTRVIRGSGGYLFESYINNTADINATNAWLNYTLPSGWINASGNLSEKTSLLEPYHIFWNNITVNITSSASLGLQTVTLKSASDQGQEDFKNLQIEVFAKTQVINITFNDTNASVGESVIIEAKLLNDLGNPVSNEQLRFYDETEGIFIGSSITNSQGIASITYDIPLDAQPGLHLINVSFFGNDASYLLYSDNQSYLDIGLKPKINALWHEPQEISYGGNISIYANLTDDDGIANAILYIEYPNGSQYSYNMTNIYGDIYSYNLTNLWDYGTYHYYVTTEDITGSKNTSQTNIFKLNSYAQVYVKTDNSSYPPNTDVYLISNKSWYYRDRYYKRKIVLENLHPFQLNGSYELIVVDTKELIDAGKLDEHCRSLAFTYYNTSSQEEENTSFYIIPGSCNRKKTYIYVYVPEIPQNGNATLFMYYDSHASVKNYASSEIEITSYDQNITIHYPVSSVHNGSDAYAIAFKDGYMIVDSTVHALTEQQPELISSTEMSQNSPIAHDVPVFIASVHDDGDAFPSIAMAGKRFTYRMDRGSDRFYVLSPWKDANCKIYDSTSLVDSFTVQKGQAVTRNTDITDGNAGILECDAPVLAFHDATGNDAYIMYPASKEWYGVASEYLMISALEDNTYVWYYKSDGTTNATPIILNRGETYRETGLGSQGAGPAVYVKANKPVGVNSIADGDGTDGTTFLPGWELSSKYYFPVDFEYIAVAVPYSFTKCDLKNSLGQVVDSKTVGNLESPYPGHMLFGAGDAGYSLECNNSVFAYYEQLSNDRETNIFGAISNRISYGYNSTKKYILEEFNQGSVVINHGNSSMHYYLVAYVQQNTTSGWVTIETIINDSSTDTLRFLSPHDSFEFASIWNASPFNTNLYPKGVYRVKVDIANKKGNILQSIYGLITNTDEFNISTGELKLNITSIRVYNITNSLNPRTSTLDLEKEGLNDTFIMYVDEIYRIEIDVNVSSDSAIWWINETNVSYENLDSSKWIIKYNDIWYRNSTDTSDRIGGKFENNILEWNTSALDGKEDPGGKVTFYFILNLTNATPDERQVTFKVVGSGVGERDISTFRILAQDNDPPDLYNNTYGLNVSYIIRGEDVLAYARWDEEISNAIIEYNSTASTLINYTITLPSPNPYNWTNYTIDTGPLWLLGNHVVKIYASDVAGNMNSSLWYLTLPVYGLASITNGYINASEIGVGDYVEIHCQVKDLSASPPSPIEGYAVYFYNSTHLLGVNYTNSSGYASWIYMDTTPGYETLKCNISDNETLFYKADPSSDEKSFTIFTKESVYPNYTLVLQNTSLIHKGESIEMDVYWHDNYQLDYAILEMNVSGTFENISAMYLSHQKDAWANFTYTYPVTYSPGYIAWKQYANDTSGNINSTSYTIFEVWGWAKISSITLNPSSMYVGNSTIISCKVIDANSSSPIEGYMVRFYNETHLLGVNYTDSNGIATWNYTDYTEGQETMTCEILDNSTLMYNASYPRNKSATLNTVVSGDAVPPHIVNNLYGLNVSYTDKVFRNESILLYGLWDEEINYSWYEINTTSPNMYFVYVPGHVNNWTNHTITLNYSWLVGVHYVKLYANDTAGNVNNTLSYLNFSVWGFSRVDWISPQDGQEVNRSIIYLITNVSDYDTWACIDGYKVDYYDNVTPGYYLGSAYTDKNNNCYANFTWDASTTEVGYHKLTAMIDDDPDKYYEAYSETSSITIIIVIMGALNTTILSPLEGSKLYRGQSYWFNSTTKDDTGETITPESVVWADNGTQIGSQENFTYTIPSNAPLGYHLIEVNTSAPYYKRGHDEVMVEYWSKADVNVTYPYNGSSVYINNTVQIKCSVKDYVNEQGIANYNVSFYVENSTYTEYLGSSLTDSSGIATLNWFVDENKYVKGSYYDIVCKINSEPELWYETNISESRNTVYINETLGVLWVELIFPDPETTTYVSRYDNFYINATVTCKYGGCGDVNATAIYNESYIISTTIGAQPFYINDGQPNPRLCLANMQPNQTCNISFLVNATGEYGSEWNVSVWFNSSLGMTNSTENAEVYIGYVLLLSVEPENITYWYLPPQDATQNYITPPVTVADPSTSMIKAANTTEIKLSPDSADGNGGLWIKGENLTSSTPGYEIPVWNITRCLGRVEDYPTPSSAQSCWSDMDNKLSYEYRQILSAMYAGDWVNLTLFLDIPPVYSGVYSGTIWIMVNASY